MTPAERKAKQRALTPLVNEQELDDRTGGLYGPGHAAEGGEFNEAIAIGERKHRVDENGEVYTDFARNGRVNTSDVEADSEDDNEPDEEKLEYDNTFQRHHPINADWKRDERDNQEQARELAALFIRSSSSAELVWDVGAKEFVCVVKLLWCQRCHKIIPAEHRCLICHKLFIFLSDAVEHIITSIDTKEGDFTHRRSILKNVRQPRTDADVRDLFHEITAKAGIASASAGWVIKADGAWVRK